RRQGRTRRATGMTWFRPPSTRTRCRLGRAAPPRIPCCRACVSPLRFLSCHLTEPNDDLAASMPSFHRTERVGDFLYRDRALDVGTQRALTHEVEQSLPERRPVLELKGDRTLARREPR